MDLSTRFAQEIASRLAAALAGTEFERAIFFEHAIDDDRGQGERLSCARFVIGGDGRLKRWTQRWQPDLPGTAEWLGSEEPWTEDLDAVVNRPVDGGGTVGDLVSVRQLRAAKVRALLGTAIYENDELAGSLIIGSRTPGAYGPAERDLIRAPAVKALMRDIVAALAMRRRNVLRQLRDLFKPNLPIDGLAQTLVTTLATENDWDFVGIYRVEQQFELVASCDRTRGKLLKIDPDYRQRLDVGMLGHTLKAGNCLRADDVTTDPPPFDYSAVEGFEARSALCYPIFICGKIEWILDCSSAAFAAFRGPDRKMLEELVNGLQLTLNLWFETRLSKAILDGLTEPIIVTDRAGIIQRTNSAARALFGLVEGAATALADLSTDEAGRRLLSPIRVLSNENIVLTTALQRPRPLIVTARLSSEAFGQFVFKFSDQGEQEWLAGLSHAREVVENEVGRSRAVLMLAGALIARVRTDLKAGEGLDTVDVSLMRVSEAISSTNLSYDRLAGLTAGKGGEDRGRRVVDTLYDLATATLPGRTGDGAGSPASRALLSALKTVAATFGPGAPPSPGDGQ